jgi:hypothetical protein
MGDGGRRLLLSGCQRQLCLCWQACFKTGVNQRWPSTRTFYTRLVTSRLLVKWCSVSKPVLVKPALNPIYTSINTGVNNTGLNKTAVSDPCKCTHYHEDFMLFNESHCLQKCRKTVRLGPHYRLFIGREFSWLLNKYEALCECAH